MNLETIIMRQNGYADWTPEQIKPIRHRSGTPMARNFIDNISDSNQRSAIVEPILFANSPELAEAVRRTRQIGVDRVRKTGEIASLNLAHCEFRQPAPQFQTDTLLALR